MSSNTWKKSLTLGIILLLISVAVAPSINLSVVKASDDNNLVEVTSQACGIQGFGNTTVKLTKQQSLDLQQYLVDFRARLNQTTTREETIPIFKDTVVELNKYGLLPRGMSVELVQKLVTGQFLNKKMMHALTTILNRNAILNESNFLCLTVATLHNCGFTTPITLVIALIWFTIFFLLLLNPGQALDTWILIGWIGFVIEQAFYSLKPFSYGYIVSFIGSTHESIRTYGLLGQKSLEGAMVGNLIGFIGLKLIFNTDDNGEFFLGFSLACIIKSNYP